MSIKYDKYYGVDFAMDFYLEMIRIWKDKRPNISSDDTITLVVNPVILARLTLSAFQSQIAITNELALDIEDTAEGKIIERKIEKQLDESPLLDKIIPKEPLTKKEIKQQLKNALSHAEYNLATKEDGMTVIEISSPKIQASFTTRELADLTDIYMKNYAETDKLEKYNIFDLLYLNINNKALLQKAVESISPNKKVQELTKDYILYIGLQNFLQLTDEERGKIFLNRIARNINNKPSYINRGDQIANLYNYASFHGKGDVSTEKFYLMTFEGPFIYTDLLLDLGFLCLNYIKEAQAKQELPNFNYHNISLKGVKYSPTTTVRIVDVAEQQTKLQNQINDLTPAMAKAKAAVEKAEEDLEKLDQNTKIPAQIKVQQYQSRKDSIIKNTQKYNELKAKINALQAQYDTAEDYVETNDFFKHLRNSISHGFYSIDYSKAFKDKDLGKIVFHFEDYEIDKNDRSIRKKVFEADISAKTLTTIFETLRNRIVENADTIAQQEDKRFIVTDQRLQKTKHKDTLTRAKDAITARGGVIVNN